MYNKSFIDQLCLLKMAEFQSIKWLVHDILSEYEVMSCLTTKNMTMIPSP